MGAVRLGRVWCGKVRYGKMTRGSVHLTSLERQARDVLEELDIGYVSQYPIHSGFVIDFAVLDQKIAIEVDGTNWHSSKEAKKRDRFKDYQLGREGWLVIRLKEKEKWKDLLSIIDKS